MDGWNAGESMYRNRMEQERLKKADEWAAEQQAQQRGQWQRDAALRTEMMNNAGRYDTDPVDETKGLYGLKPADVVNQTTAGKYNQRQGFYDGTSVPSTGAGFATPGVEPTFGVNPQRKNLAADYRMSAMAGDRVGMSNVSAKLSQLDMDSQTAMLQQRLRGASPEAVAAFARDFTSNTNIPGELSIDASTKLATLKPNGGAPVQMTRTQLEQYIAGLYMRSKGDPKGTDVLAGVDKSLVDMADKMYGRLKDSATNTNDVVLKGNTMRNDNQRTANSGAELGLRTAAANKPNYVQLVDANGEAQMVNANALPEKDGVIQLPAGLKYPSQRAQVSPEAQQKYREAILELGLPPQPGTTQAEEWKARKLLVDQVYGVQEAPNALPQVAPPPRVAAPPAAVATQPEPRRAMDPKARAAVIQEALARDDNIKSEFGGIGLRAIQQGAMPMGMSQRAELEAELRRLTGGR